ncbi:MAG TPA: phosphonate ABC transporter ATP-binding protein, partial [Tepidisphaeraceae bacterium]|nr:phosphonate ABC transporter ATP-binding protein [Tepidisphaeraceae bacterium]
GAGKSTLLRTVNGLAAPTAGRVTVDGTAVTPATLQSVRLRVGMIHQQFNLIPRLSVLKNVLCGALPAVPWWRALLHWFPVEMRRKACELIGRVGLGEEHLYRRASELSGGQQQRVGIARALMMDPAVILADEPVASLDPRISRGIIALLREAAKERNCTVLCSLHQIELAEEFGERIVGMHAGRVTFDGTAADLTDDVLARIYGRAHSSPERRPVAGVPADAPAASPVRKGARRHAPAIA